MEAMKGRNKLSDDDELREEKNGNQNEQLVSTVEMNKSWGHE